MPDLFHPVQRVQSFYRVHFPQNRCRRRKEENLCPSADQFAKRRSSCLRTINVEKSSSLFKTSVSAFGQNSRNARWLRRRNSHASFLLRCCCSRTVRDSRPDRQTDTRPTLFAMNSASVKTSIIIRTYQRVSCILDYAEFY